MPGKVDLSGLTNLGSLIGIGVVFIIVLIIAIVIISIIVKSVSSSGTKNSGVISTTGTIIRYDIDPQNAFAQYPVISFYDEDIGEFVEGTANKIKLRKQPKIGDSVNITYKRVKRFGCPVYIVNIV